MTQKNITILLVEDNPGDVRLIIEMLREVQPHGFNIIQASTLARACELLKKENIDVVLLDLSLPDSRGLETFKSLKDYVREVPVLLLTGLNDETLAVESVRAGAQDYLVKGHIAPELLVRSIRYAIERKRVETRLANEKERLDVVLSSIGDGVIATNTEGLIMLINPVAEVTTGWLKNSALNRKISEVFRAIEGTTNAPCNNPVKAAIENGDSFSLPMDAVLLSRDGPERNIEASAYPLRDPNSKIIGVVIVFRDVTEKNRIERELTKVQKLESLGILAGGIAHDFNNILTAILNSLAYTRLNMDSGTPIYESIADTEKAAMEARKLTNQLLTFAKGGVPITQTVSLEKIIKDQLRFILAGSNVESHITSDDKLWLVDVDVGQFNQVISNIAINAKEAMPDGGVLGINLINEKVQEPRHWVTKKGNYVKVEIKDNGVGIPLRYLDKIFDPYFSTKRQGGGLGLAIAYSIIKHHRGFLAVDSQPGEGTVFSLYLPVSTHTIESQIPSEAELKKGHGRILIMDDDKSILTTTSRILSSIGYEVACVENGEKAVTLYEEEKSKGKTFDIVILDLVVPGGMGGKETLEKLLEIDDQVKAIVSSGYSQDPIMANYLEHGFKAVMPKPYSVNAISTILYDLLND